MHLFMIFVHVFYEARGVQAMRQRCFGIFMTAAMLSSLVAPAGAFASSSGSGTATLRVPWTLTGGRSGVFTEVVAWSWGGGIVTTYSGTFSKSSIVGAGMTITTPTGSKYDVWFDGNYDKGFRGTWKIATTVCTHELNMAIAVGHTGLARNDGTSTGGICIFGETLKIGAVTFTY